MSDSKFQTLMGITILAYCMLVGMQGFDLCDEGWVLTGYQQIFNDPSSVTYQFLYYVSLFAGGLWNKLFSSCGYYGFRVFTALCVTAVSILVFRTLRQYANRWCVFTGLLLCVSFFDDGIFVFHHNIMSMLMVALSCCLFMKGTATSKLHYFLFAGIVTGVNIFSRLPNVTMCAMIAALIPSFCFAKNGLRKSLSLISGWGCGISLVLLVMVTMGHLTIFTDALAMLREAGNDPSSTHALPRMLAVYLGYYFRLALCSVCVLFFPAVIYLLRNKAGSKANGMLWAACFVVEVLISLYFKPLIYVYSVSTIAILYCMYRNCKAHDILALVWLHLLPIGSDFGIGNMGLSCIWLAVPLAVSVLYESAKELGERHFRKFQLLLVAIICLIACRNIRSVVKICYLDEAPFTFKTFRVDHEKANVFTSQRNKKAIEPLLCELRKYVKKDDYLFEYMKCPMIHYLTETRPYMGNSWVWSYSPRLIRSQLAVAEQRHANLPVLVREKSAIPAWYLYDEDWNNDKAQETYEHKNEKVTIINDFIARHAYKVVWEDDLFQILLAMDN